MVSGRELMNRIRDTYLIYFFIFISVCKTYFFLSVLYFYFAIFIFVCETLFSFSKLYSFAFICCIKLTPYWRLYLSALRLGSQRRLFCICCNETIKLLFQLWGIIKLQIQYCFD